MFIIRLAVVAQLVERQPSKLKVASSSLVRRSERVDSVRDRVIGSPARRGAPEDLLALERKLIARSLVVH